MRTVPIAVIGGGITGQLVQHLIPDAEVYDWMPSRQPLSLVRSFGANYLWRPLDGLPWKSFPVVTTVDGEPPTFDNVAKYKLKIGKTGDITGWERQFQHTMTGYDFVSLPTSRVSYDHRIVEIDRVARTLTFANQPVIKYETLVSTIPLYSLLSLMGMPEPRGRLRHKPIFFKITPRPPDAPHPVDTLYVNYISNPDIAPYRFTDRFGERHYESIIPYPDSATKVRRYAPGKIYPHADVPELLDVLSSLGIVTFGRFGSWNPDELVHETWDRIVEWKTLIT